MAKDSSFTKNALKPSGGNDINSDADTKFRVCDIEVRDWVNFIVLGDYDGKEFTSYLDLKDYFNFLRRLSGRQIVYAHFGGKFDFLFLIEFLFFKTDIEIVNMIPQGSRILCFEAHIPPRISKEVMAKWKRKIPKDELADYIKDYKRDHAKIIYFRDSSAMLPFALRSLCENFKVEHLKLDIDYDTIKEATPELLKYLEYDCKGLWEVIHKYLSWPLIKQAGAGFTMAGQAMKVLKLFLDEPIRSLPQEVDDFVRPAYYGGRTEIFKPLFIGDKKNKKLNCFDVNSLYPTVMRLFEMPSGYSNFTSKYDGKAMGVFEATVDVPKGMYVPPLGTVIEMDGVKKYIFPTGRFSGKWTTLELEYARSIGVKIVKTGRGLIFTNGGNFFKNYIDTLYDIRQKSAKDSVDNLLAKLLMNSCYGRFGLNVNREEIIIDDGSAGVRNFMDIEGDKGKRIKLVTKPKTLNTFNNVGVALWVTAASRVFMHKIYSKCPETLYYTDTDSLFTTSEMPRDDKGLGGLKLEYAVGDACFLLPKTYVVKALENIFDEFDEKGKKKKTKSNKKVVMKGFDKKKIQHFDVDDFVTALEGDLRRLKISYQPQGIKTFKTAIKKNRFVAKHDYAVRVIHAQYDKRRIFKTEKGWDSEPWHLKNGEIVNRAKPEKKSKRLK